MSKPEDFKFDSRVRDRLLRSRVLSTADVQLHLEQLPDLEGEYEVLTDTPQPAVAPSRSEASEEPLVFDGIRRLQALGEVSSPPAPRYAPPYAPPVAVPQSSALPSYREPEPRGLGTPLRSALMESEISGVGAGAVSAALGAMAAEARSASAFVVPAAPIPYVPPNDAESTTPVTLRSEAHPPAAPSRAEADEDGLVDADEEDEEEEDADDDDDDTDEDDVEGDEEVVDAQGSGSEPESEDVA